MSAIAVPGVDLRRWSAVPSEGLAADGVCHEVRDQLVTSAHTEWSAYPASGDASRARWPPTNSSHWRFPTRRRRPNPQGRTRSPRSRRAASRRSVTNGLAVRDARSVAPERPPGADGSAVKPSLGRRVATRYSTACRRGRTVSAPRRAGGDEVKEAPRIVARLKKIRARSFRPGGVRR